MERKSGFKECPRCGLRNKLAAVQCDFCGWEFHEASEEWSSHVKVLDRLNRDVDSVVLDDELSRKIESTIVRGPREATPPSPKPVPTVDEIATIEADAELRSEGRRWSSEHRLEAEMAPAESHEVKVFVDTMIGGPTPGPAPSPADIEIGVAVTESPVNDLRPDQLIEERSEKALALSTRDGLGMPAGLMGGGVVVYAIALVAYSNTAIGLYLGWGLVIFGALVFTLGANWFYSRRAKGMSGEERMIGGEASASNEVVICPNCNELVGQSVDSCPNCGVRFDQT
ncbi:MAG: hypothetical protein ABR879_05820 [Methanomassiliicoccales archaeon]